MASIPLAALHINSYPGPGPLQQYAEMQQIQGQQQERQLREQQIQGVQQENQLRQLQVQERQTLMDTSKGIDWTQPDAFQKFITNAQQSGKVSPQTLSQMSMQRQQYLEQLQKTDAASLDLDTKRGEKLLGHIDAIRGITDPAKRAAAAQVQGQQILAGGLVKDPNSLQKIQAMAAGQYVPTDDELDTEKAGLLDHKTQVAEVQKNREVAAQEQTAQARATSAETSAKEFQAKLPGGPLNRVTQDIAVATNPEIQRGKIQVAAAEGAARLQQQAALLQPNAIDLAAQNYLQTGQMPAGMRSPGMSSQIINRAGQMAQQNPEMGNLSANKAAYEANKKSYDNATKTLDTLTAFENVSKKNLQNFLSLAEKLPDTGLPWLNKPVRELDKNLVGDANLPAIEAAKTVALREIARVTNDPKLSGVLSDSARQEVEGLIPDKATLPQIKNVARVLIQDVDNVHQSVAAQKSDIGQRMGIKATSQQGGGATGSSSFTRIKASDGSLHDIPSDKLDAAKKIDPKLTVVQ